MTDLHFLWVMHSCVLVSFLLFGFTLGEWLGTLEPYSWKPSSHLRPVMQHILIPILLHSTSLQITLDNLTESFSQWKCNCLCLEKTFEHKHCLPQQVKRVLILVKKKLWCTEYSLLAFLLMMQSCLASRVRQCKLTMQKITKCDWKNKKIKIKIKWLESDLQSGKQSKTQNENKI